MELDSAACDVCGKTYLNCVFCVRSEEDLQVFNFYHEVLNKMATNYHNSFVKNATSVTTTSETIKKLFLVDEVRPDVDLDAMFSRWIQFILYALGQDRLITMMTKNHYHFPIILCNFALMQAVLPSNWSQVPQVVKTYLERTTRIESQCPVENKMGAFNESLINAAKTCNELQINNNEMRFLLTLVVVDNQCCLEKPEVSVLDDALEFFERIYMKDEKKIRFGKLLGLYRMVQKLVNFMTPIRLLSPLDENYEYDEYPMPKDQIDAIGAILFSLPTNIIL